jgi:hypothetical protein
MPNILFQALMSHERLDRAVHVCGVEYATGMPLSRCGRMHLQVAPADLVALDRACFTTSSAQRAALRERLKADIKDLKERMCIATFADDPLLQA